MSDEFKCYCFAHIFLLFKIANDFSLTTIIYIINTSDITAEAHHTAVVFLFSEARKVLGRDVVLGVVSECLGPCGGKMMSSSALQPSALETSATTVIAATLSPTTTIATTPNAAEATATHADAALALSSASPSATSGRAVSSAVSSPIKNITISATLSQSHCIQSLSCTNKGSSILTTSLAETTSDRVGTENDFKLPPLSKANSESSDLKWQSQQLSESIYVNPQSGTSTSISVCSGVGQSGGGLLVPSAVCWQQRGRGVPAQQQLVGAEGGSGAAPLHIKACADPRPPVLGEEQRTGQEEDLTIEHEMFMQGQYLTTYLIFQFCSKLFFFLPLFMQSA